MAISQVNLARQKLADGGVRDRITGCRLWTGGTNGGGYGAVWIDGKSMQVHIVQDELDNGPIPKGMVVAHSCDNTLCYESAHLTRKTQSQNIADACIRGRLPGLALNPEKVRAIRALKGRDRAKDVAISYGVTTRTIYRIWAGKAWAFV